MKNRSWINPQFAFWGICLFVTAWIAATLLFEFHLGWPMSPVQWAKRLVGWGVEGWLIRTFAFRVRHYYQTLATR